MNFFNLFKEPNRNLIEPQKNERQSHYNNANEVLNLTDKKSCLAMLEEVCLHIDSGHPRTGDEERLTLIRERARELKIPDSEVAEIEQRAKLVAANIVRNYMR